MAPEADLLLVSLNQAGQLADSTFAVDAINYLLRKAKSEPLNRPLVINLSQGDNFGPHDGTSLLEQAIDSALNLPSVSIVKSAGNETGRKSHTSGRVSDGGETAVGFEVQPNRSEETFDIWYSGADLFDLAVETPGGVRTTPVSPESDATLTLANGNEVYVVSQLKDPENGDNRINIVLRRGARNMIRPGRWAIILDGRRVADGRFNIWIDNSEGLGDATFVEPKEESTITIPGTSRGIITVGAFITKLREQETPTDLGAIWPSSSNGPTRRGLRKPDISAPGAFIKSARRSSAGAENYVLMEGTSMAAPHVAGVIALLFEKNPTLTQQEIKDFLQASASRDERTGHQPNNTWGHGRLNAQDTYDSVP